MRKSVFLVHHSYQLDDESSSEETKLIGAYSTRRKAQQAVRRLRRQPGFKRLPKYFSIDEYLIDQDNWTEGFVTKRETVIYSVWKTGHAKRLELVKESLVETDALRLVREMKRQGINAWAKEHA